MISADVASSFFQESLLKYIKQSSSSLAITPQLEDAFRATPRHHFIHRYRLPAEEVWLDAATGDPSFHYEKIYRDWCSRAARGYGTYSPRTHNPPSSWAWRSILRCNLVITFWKWGRGAAG